MYTLCLFERSLFFLVTIATLTSISFSRNCFSKSFWFESSLIVLGFVFFFQVIFQTIQFKNESITEHCLPVLFVLTLILIGVGICRVNFRRLTPINQNWLVKYFGYKLGFKNLQLCYFDNKMGKQGNRIQS